MNMEALAAVRQGAEIQSIKPYMDKEIEGMLKSVVSFVLAAVNNGTLTPETAMAKWIEYVSYVKLAQKLEQRIRIGQSVGAQNAKELDLSNKNSYTTKT